MGGIDFLGEAIAQNNPVRPLRLTDPKLCYQIEDRMATAIISAAVWSEKHRPGCW